LGGCVKSFERTNARIPALGNGGWGPCCEGGENGGFLPEKNVRIAFPQGVQLLPVAPRLILNAGTLREKKSGWHSSQLAHGGYRLLPFIPDKPKNYMSGNVGEGDDACISAINGTSPEALLLRFPISELISSPLNLRSLFSAP
jgi:hypothetical protein